MAKKILVVEDSRAILRLVRRFLEDEGFEVITAADGRQGLSRALGESTDLLILDIELPWMDGFEVCRRLRSHPNPSIARLPVLMMTSRSHGEDLSEAEEAGADHYLLKRTFTRDELTRAVKALFDQREVERV